MADKNQEDPLLSAVLNTIRASVSLSAQDVEFFRSLDPDISASVDQTAKGVLNLINDILLSVDGNEEVIESGKEGLENAWKNVGEVMDTLFEKSDHAFSAIRRTDNNNKTNYQYLDDAPSVDQNHRSKRIEKPQLNFKRPVDNSELQPFKPLLKSKPHSIISLSEVLKILPAEENVPSHYAQPYEHEIDNQKYSNSVLEVRDPISPQPWEQTEATWVDSAEALNKMVSELRSANEIAVDLEHHDYRSYYGITCLMQISTRNQDWLVDTIALRDDLEVLNEIFTDPLILKVFHGAFMDIIWLQRDLGLYVVSLFDTYHASRLLGFPKHSLAYLLETIAHFKTSKKYQLADWRIRPLSKPLKAYARSDTHFLLYIYDHLRNSLIKQNKLAQALNDSRNVAKRRFEYSRFKPVISSTAVYSPIEKDEPWRNLMYQYNLPSAKEPLVKSIYEWRDFIARKDDESPRYVMPNQLLVSLVATAPTTPTDVMSVSTLLTDHVRSNSKTISNLIKATMETIREGAKPGLPLEFSKDSDAQNLTVSQIQSMLEEYKRLEGKLKAKLAATFSSSAESVLFHGNSDLDEKVVSYEDAVKVVSGTQDLIKRRDALLNAITDSRKPTIIDIEVTAGKPDDGPSDYIPQQEVSRAEEKLSTPDPTDIIVLKERRQHTKPQRGYSKGSEESENVLYLDKQKKILNERGGQTRLPKKSRKFDPYSSDNVGPQVAKKRKKAHGKQGSFKK
ncbi:LAFE_0E01002g1_1 [Lachancea fermentati]|uniref:LAFE_0E01002g1_1 n=1 Tax=Lachancea fermentati TaxID=4955 RepID=A0A1G4MCF3_LACFM|nr:LAFE_0E01002g1_1 [Lachancea fermentati]